MVKPRKLFAVAAFLILTLTACSSGSGGSSNIEVPIFAAASLNKVFTQFEAEFEAENPQYDLVFNFAGSGDLVSQMQAGAPYAVFASANEKWMDEAVKHNLVSNPQIFANNTLALAVAANNPKQITNLSDLVENPDLIVARCAADVPCGSLTDKVLAAAAVDISFDTEQNSVTDTLGVLLSGQADAAFIYSTDIAGANEVEPKVISVPLPQAAEFIQAYPIAIASDNQSLSNEQISAAKAFVEYVMSAEAKAQLLQAGFIVE